MTTSTPPSWSAAGLDHALARSRAEQRAALGLYLPVGYPTRAAGLDALHLMAKHADVLQLGVPHTDPVLDGPVIRRAAAQALDAGFRMRDLFDAATELTAAGTTAVLAMSYWKPIEAYGPRAFAEELAAAGVAGVLVPDLPETETETETETDTETATDTAAATWQRAARAAGLHTSTLIPPRASDAHLAALGSVTSGLIHVPATPGLTGARRPLSPYLPHLVRRVRTLTGLPVAVGIGIGTPDQAAQASAYADSVIVGSAVIRRMHAQPGAAAVTAAEAARDFAEGVRRARPPAT
ncbi:tryptophan synthase subunit alpha [Streptomyces prunicolor]|uniref:tryptophan synthase subunit alpha n=2 Tax=Streptomyces prunicolor TaxID=67348 RepID=UPI003422B69C